MRLNGITLAAFISSIVRPWQLPSHLMELSGYDGNSERRTHPQEFNKHRAGTSTVRCLSRQRPDSQCQGHLCSFGSLEGFPLDLHGDVICAADAGSTGLIVSNDDVFQSSKSALPQQCGIVCRG